MSMIRFLCVSFLALSLTTATVFADTSNQNSSSVPAAPDNSTTVTTPSNDNNANAGNNLVSNHANSSAKKLQSVNINTADAKTIADSLHGIGPKRAAAIVAYRTQNGPFKSVDDLAKIKGISQKIVDLNRERITLS